MIMSGNRQYCFTHSSGEDIYLFALCNAKGTEVLITNYGAIITSFKIKQRGGTTNDIVLGFENVKDYLAKDYLKKYPWFGAAIGRYANRIGGCSFIIDGKTYALPANIPGNHLHGGVTGFDKKVWHVDSFIQSPKSSLTLDYFSVDGEEGYPGNLKVTLQFELSDNDELSYAYFAHCDQPTAINLTHHSYFNLNNGKGTIKEYLLKIYADSILEQDDHLITTGKITPVANSAFDFREFYRIGDGLKRVDEYDKSFVTNSNTGDSPEIQLVAEAKSEQSNILLQVYSTDPVVHFYSGKWIPVVNGKEGNKYGSFAGFCLETHKHPNAINIPHFPNTVLRPGEKYYQKNIYKVIT
jgi:aldose 1-epimerase